MLDIDEMEEDDNTPEPWTIEEDKDIKIKHLEIDINKKNDRIVEMENDVNK